MSRSNIRIGPIHPIRPIRPSPPGETARALLSNTCAPETYLTHSGGSARISPHCVAPARSVLSLGGAGQLIEDAATAVQAQLQMELHPGADPAPVASGQLSMRSRALAKKCPIKSH